jgi:hypothetical protein
MSKRLRSSDRIANGLQKHDLLSNAEDNVNKKQKVGCRDHKKIVKKWWKDHHNANQITLARKEELETENLHLKEA